MRVRFILKGILKRRYQGFLDNRLWIFCKAPTLLMTTGENFYIVVPVKERKNSYLFAMLALSDDQLGGSVNAAFVNPFGGARRFALSWEKLKKDRTTFSLSIGDPLFLGSLWALEGKFTHKDYNGYAYRTGSISFLRPLGYSFSIGGKGGLGFVLPDSSGLYSYRIPKESSVSFSLFTQLETGGGAKGLEGGVTVSCETGGKYSSFSAPVEISSFSNLDDLYQAVFDMEGKFAYYNGSYGIFSRVSTGGTVLKEKGRELPVSSFRYIGGYSTVRGHIEDELTGTYSFSFGIEPRLVFREGQGGFFAFYDFGAIKQNDGGLRAFRAMGRVFCFVPGLAFLLRAMGFLRQKLDEGFIHVAFETNQ
jgi:outer membrane protein assembly factor BamA